MRISVKLKHKVGREQRVVLLLHEIPLPGATDEPRTYRFEAPRNQDENLIAVPISGVPEGEYLVRLQVDGLDSWKLNADGKFALPRVSVPTVPQPEKPLRSSDIRLTFEKIGAVIRVRGDVIVVDQNKSRLANATVSVRWTLPDGRNEDHTLTTNQDGIASFTISNGEGTYKLTVTEIKKDGYTFDRANSVLSKEIRTSRSLRSKDIRLVVEETGAVIRVRGNVIVEDQNGALLANATVAVTWNLPDGRSEDHVLPTNDDGVASFTNSDGEGTYRLTVTEITKAGYTFDRANSVLSKEIHSSRSLSLRSKDIQLAVEETGNVTRVRGNVIVEDQNNSRLANATVAVTWALPDGRSEDHVLPTNDDGVASFTNSDGEGIYKLTVAEITKAGYTFDRANSVLSKEIHTSRSLLLRSKDIRLVVEETGNVVRVRGNVIVEDQNGALLANATVAVTWASPDGRSEDHVLPTNDDGVASFTNSDGEGTYKLTVAEITKAGYTFDRANSVLSKEIKAS